MAGIVSASSASAYSTSTAQAPVTFEQTHEASTLAIVASINGSRFDVKSVSIEKPAHGAAGSAEFVIPLAGSPDFTSTLSHEAIGNALIPVQVYMGLFQAQPRAQTLDISGLTQVFSGFLDLYTIDYPDADGSEGSITFHCRSIAAQLIDNRITQIPQNMTTVAFVAQVALQYGMQPVFYLPEGFVASNVAAVFRQTFSVGVQNPRVWDLLMQFAQIDDVDVWDDGATLYYAAPSAIPRQRLPLAYGRDIAKISVQHAPYASQSIRVEVRTYNPKTTQSSVQRIETNDDGGVDVTSTSKIAVSNPEFGTPTTDSYSISATGTVTHTQTTSTGGVKTANSGGKAPSYNGPLIYKFYEPNLSLQDANKKAQTIWHQISERLYNATITVPLTRATFSGLISISTLIVLSGLPNRNANGTYWPRTIRIDASVDAAPMVVIQAQSALLPDGEV